LSDENKEMLRLAFTGTERLRDLVNDLLDIARLESGKIEYEYSQVDLLKAINDTLGLQRAFAVEHGSTLMLTGMDAVEFVHTDKAKLTEVLTNIVSNAVKYGRKDGGLVEVSVVHDGDFARVAIKDNGLGIPADQQGKMFEKFFRVSTPERAEIVGTGLGMHISKQYIEEMGGKLWFDSVEGQGTTFYFTVALKPGATSGTLDTKKEDAASA
jgi:signal transduction histidine kinase